jgi:hypothetical protein
MCDHVTAARGSVEALVNMKAKVLKIGALGNCETRTETNLLVVFSLPRLIALRLGDLLEFDDLGLDRDVSVRTISRDIRFIVHIAANDVHDLDLPIAHGTGRTPSEERLRRS